MDSNKLISKLTKRDILALPGFSGLNKVLLPKLKEMLRAHLIKKNIFKRGVRIKDYLDYYKQNPTEQIKIETPIPSLLESRRLIQRDPSITIDKEATTKTTSKPTKTKTNPNLKRGDKKKINDEIAKYNTQLKLAIQNKKDYEEDLQEAKKNKDAKVSIEECNYYINKFTTEINELNDKIFELKGKKYNQPELEQINKEILTLKTELDNISKKHIKYGKLETNLKNLIADQRGDEDDLINGDFTEDEKETIKQDIKNRAIDIDKTEKLIEKYKQKHQHILNKTDSEIETMKNKLNQLQNRKHEIENEINKLDKPKSKAPSKPRQKLTPEQKKTNHERMMQQRRENKLLFRDNSQLKREEQFDRSILANEKMIDDLNKQLILNKNDQKQTAELHNAISALNRKIAYIKNQKTQYIENKNRRKK